MRKFCAILAAMALLSAAPACERLSYAPTAIRLCCAYAQDAGWDRLSAEISGGYCVRIDRSNPHEIYFGTSKGLFKSEDSGLNWKRILHSRNMTVYQIICDQADNGRIYAATNKGIYSSLDAGESWKQIYRGTNAYEADCRAVSSIGKELFAATQQGLAVSRDAGVSWNRESGELGKIAVSAVNADKAADAYIYAATAAGVYRRRVAVSSDTSAIGSGAWEKVYVERKSSYENGSSQSNSGDENGFDQTNSGFADTENSGTYTPNGLSLIHDMCVDTARPGVVYLATANGVVKSADSGATWQDMTDSGLMIKDVTAIATGDGSRLYAAAGTDVYFYDQDRWKCVSAGVTLKTARDIVSANGSVYAASEAGLYRMRIDVRREDRGDSDAAFTRDLPSIQAVQKAAIEYADADIDKIQQWRKQARNKAFLPDLDVGVNQDTSELWHWEGGSTTREYDDLLRKGKNVYEWDVSLSWDLGELIWNDAQTSIDTRARLLVQLRQDVLDEVTKLYFEYVRVRQEMDSLSFLDKKKLAEKQIRLAELAAQLDGLTGNFFSK